MAGRIEGPDLITLVPFQERSKNNEELIKTSRQCCCPRIDRAEPSQAHNPVTAAMSLQATMPLRQLLPLPGTFSSPV